MKVFNSRNGFQITQSRIFNGVTLTHMKRAQLKRGQRRILRDDLVEVLWSYFENPQRLVVQETVELVEADEGRSESGLKLWSTYRSSAPVATFVSDEEVAALRELHDQLEGKLPKEV